jgi:thioesterase domain-containing protein
VEWKRYLEKKLEYRREVHLANKMRFRRLERKDEAPNARLEAHNRKLAQLEYVYNTNLRALDHFKPQPYAGKVTLFNAEQTDPGVIRDPLGAWPGLAREIEVHPVPGNHDTMLTEPNVAVLARTIDHCLRRAQAEAAAR